MSEAETGCQASSPSMCPRRPSHRRGHGRHRRRRFARPLSSLTAPLGPLNSVSDAGRVCQHERTRYRARPIGLPPPTERALPRDRCRHQPFRRFAAAACSRAMRSPRHCGRCIEQQSEDSDRARSSDLYDIGCRLRKRDRDRFPINREMNAWAPQLHWSLQAAVEWKPFSA